MLVDLEDENKFCSSTSCPQLSSLKTSKYSVLTYHKTVKHGYSILIIFSTPNFDFVERKIRFPESCCTFQTSSYSQATEMLTALYLDKVVTRTLSILFVKLNPAEVFSLLPFH